MVDQPPKRQIQIKIKGTQPEAHRGEPVQEYVYHWDRIIGALAALLLLLGALGYGISALLEPPTRPAGTEVQERQMPDEMAVAGPSRRDGAANATTSPAGQAAAPAVTARMPGSQPSGAEPRPSEEKPLIGPERKSSVADASAIPSGEAADVASEPDSSAVAAHSSASSGRSNQGLFRLTKTSIASPTVKRFLLAKDVLSNEPHGDIGDIALNGAKYVAVSSFSEVTGQQGETLQYRWLYNGKQVLRIRVPVGSKRWRSHSTKRIYAGMKGSWRVELRNSAGELLASIDFTF
jgi:hypothetical protein